MESVSEILCPVLIKSVSFGGGRMVRSKSATIVVRNKEDDDDDDGDDDDVDEVAVDGDKEINGFVFNFSLVMKLTTTTTSRTTTTTTTTTSSTTLTE